MNDSPAPATLTTAPRVRFAPSPTGFFHVGSARTALYNWLYAEANGGTFILRIEDTDEERGRQEWLDGIIEALHWLSLEPFEGPYRQSERQGLYEQALSRLFEEGWLYGCNCSRDEVVERTRHNKIPGYDGKCRDLGLPREGNALRFRIPTGGTTTVHDLVRGDVEFPHDAMEDFVVAKSNGNPLFILANVVDDIDMNMTHVIRGEDLLPSTPKGILLWQALEGSGACLPAFAHLPMLVNEKRQKLSKRRDPVSLDTFREQGFLPEAMVNYLALLGWSDPQGRELLSRAELVGSFSIDRVNHAPAFFDVAKLTHMNGEHIRALDAERFAGVALDWLRTADVPWEWADFDMGLFSGMVPLVIERVTTLGEVVPMVDFLFTKNVVFDEDSLERVRRETAAAAVLRQARSRYETCAWSAGELHQVTQEIAEAEGMKLGRAQAPVRVAITGRRVGPPLFDSMALLARDVVLSRLDALIAVLGS